MTSPSAGMHAQPPAVDDRLPVILVVLDGLGDRPIPELGGRTPAEAARTPILDELARRGASGWHIPFGWGRAPASELAHWAMFGYADVAFPGRAVLEGIGAGLDVPCGVAVTFAALRSSVVTEGQAWITGRAGSADEADTGTLLGELSSLLEEHGARLHPLARGEGILVLARHPCGQVTDSDPFFEALHPWLRVLPADPAAAGTAEELNALLLEARHVLLRSGTNRARLDSGKPALDVLTTKWSGTRRPLPGFNEQAGVAGAAVTSTRLYRGIAGLLGMAEHHQPPIRDLATDMRARLDAAVRLLAEGARFVHVHVKATDEAGHTKQPRAKLEVLEALDPGLESLEALAGRAIVAVTGDHATPSVDGVLHTADPTPLVIAGPTVRADRVTTFGETPSRDGWYGAVAARDLLPLLFAHANRPVFLGHRATPAPTLALPDDPQPMRLA